MSRRTSQAAGTGVSLFPFLSILACMIGILTMMIQIISELRAQETAGRDEQEMDRAKQFHQVQVEIKKQQGELKEIKATLKKRNLGFAQLSELENKRIVLRKQLDGIKAKPKEGDETQQKLLERLIDQIAALKTERPSLENELAALKEELARRKIKPDAKKAPVRINPGGSGISWNTRLVIIECHGKGLVILQKNGDKIPVSMATIRTDGKLATAMKEAKASRDHLVLFLMRPDGFPSYREAALLAEGQYEVRTGKLSVPTQGEIDLSLFFKR